ncbi:peptide/nickel transport system permease protein [Halanaerobium saccharolyticum]|uniref:Peptide/nickel transport system permease protein n=1 Tax=Halanaerobium saccharolyticum TaxID=43595 RepID=A0A4R7Z925_9FIRM|nr:ABC transporter permease [Halanaerobium saccharolyticum]RAK11916.1 peptide/nickel transport system permease protein [Halanaerobium saccharolyticum]TDW07757.1 peptide/nickel transport system permease protein [Halanaerobium saccharolyticum]TDX64678.1 peptide/nickel transport system permease protein [Halanaerobium saccharolyticum]
MRNYIIKRILLLIPIIFIVAVIAFFITNLMPGDPVRVILGNMATESEVARLEQTLGLDQPLIVRFFRWLANIMRGDFGDSLYLNAPVAEVLIKRLRPTFLIAILAEILGIAGGMLLGILAAVKHRKFLDQFSITLSLFGISIPSFWLALMLMYLFSVRLGWFPVSGYEPFAEAGFGTLRYIILPAVTLAFMQAGLIARMTRSAMLDTLKQDYIRTAKSKGLSTKSIVFKHALKNSMMPVITVIGHNFAVLLGGTWIVETIFVIPGTGFMAINAIMRRDIPVIQASIIFVAVIYIILNLFVDLSYAFLNPKIRYN